MDREDSVGEWGSGGVGECHPTADVKVKVTRTLTSRSRSRNCREKLRNGDKRITIRLSIIPVITTLRRR